MLVPLFPALDSRTITGLGTNLTAQIKERSRAVQREGEEWIPGVIQQASVSPALGGLTIGEQDAAPALGKLGQ